MDPICLIFLDIDGVVNREMTKSFAERTPESVAKFDKDALMNLDLLLEDIVQAGYQPGIVISSSWRLRLIDGQRILHDLEYLKELFQIHSFSRYILGSAPPISHLRSQVGIGRYMEISRWIIDNLYRYQIKNLIVIDDLPMPNLGDHFVLCDAERLFGEAERKKAIELIHRNL